MRTYHGNSKEKTKKKNFFVKNIYAFMLGFAIIAIALTVTLSLTLGRSVPDAPAVIPPDNSNKITFVLPMANAQTLKGASYDEHVLSGTTGQWMVHKGIDFSSTDSRVFAVANGTVEVVGNTAFDGMCITVAHSNGFKTVYKSLAQEVKVSVGDKVSAGDVIGTASDTMVSELSEGVHLHLEMMLNNVAVDPTEYLGNTIDK